MNDLDTLHDAFHEYERRADGFAPQQAAHTTRSRRTRGPVLVAVSVLAVAGIAVAAVLIGSNSGSSPAPRERAGAGSSSPRQSLVATSSVSKRAVPSATSTHKHLAPSTHARSKRVAVTGDYRTDFVGAFKRVLGDSATFTISDREGGAAAYAIVGVITNAASVSGGFDVQYLGGDKGDVPTCPDTDMAHCTVKDVAGGGAVAYIKDPLLGAPDSYSNIVEYVRPDGVHFIMSASNQRDGKGLSPKLADAPPFTMDQIIAILTSDKW